MNNFAYMLAFCEYKDQHPLGTKLMTCFEENPTEYCVVLGSKWQNKDDSLNGGKEPMYIVLIDGKLSSIYLPSAHDEGEWEVV